MIPLAHSPDLKDTLLLLEEFNFITVKFLPPAKFSHTAHGQYVNSNGKKKLHIKAMFQKRLDVISDAELTIREFMKNNSTFSTDLVLYIRFGKESHPGQRT